MHIYQEPPRSWIPLSRTPRPKPTLRPFASLLLAAPLVDQPPSQAAVVVRPDGVSGRGTGKVLLKAVVVLVLFALLCGAVVVVADAVIVVILVIAGPAQTQPIY